jgi:cytosine/adenosine deaminase-related metal-dependent hydrolase
VFPQEGLTNNPGTEWLLIEGLRRGARTIGAVPRLGNYGIYIGAAADLVCIDAKTPADAISTLAVPLWGLERGRRSFTRSRVELHAPKK